MASWSRGVVLDPDFVKAYAKKQNIQKKHEFELTYDRFFKYLKVRTGGTRQGMEWETHG